MSDGSQQFSKRTKGRVEVRHRTGSEAAARRQAGLPQVEKMTEYYSRGGVEAP
ncbi:MAG: hypothetical protein OSA48_08390 [Akkermansiaceae bacterium]|nr:hypothetical protein [Akkermansiaceae bacterium]